MGYGAKLSSARIWRRMSLIFVKKLQNVDNLAFTRVLCDRIARSVTFVYLPLVARGQSADSSAYH
jgi:hypothetical protein